MTALLAGAVWAGLIAWLLLPPERTKLYADDLAIG